MKMKLVKTFNPLFRTMFDQMVCILFKKEDTTSSTGTSTRFLSGFVKKIDDAHVYIDEVVMLGGILATQRRTVAFSSIQGVTCIDGHFETLEQKEFGYTFNWTEGKGKTLVGTWSCNAVNLADAKRKFRVSTQRKALPAGCKVAQGPLLVVATAVSADLGAFYSADKEAVKSGFPPLCWVPASSGLKGDETYCATTIIAAKAVRFKVIRPLKGDCLAMREVRKGHWFTISSTAPSLDEAKSLVISYISERVQNV